MNTLTRFGLLCSLMLIASVAWFGCGSKLAEQPPTPAQPAETPAAAQPASPAAAEVAAPSGNVGEEEKASVAVEQAQPSEEKGEEEIASTSQETEWVSLFNGEDLTGWRNARDPSGDITWTVEDGAMTNVEHGHDIATVDFFKDFDLRLEYKTVPGGNSGVYLRGRIEIQVLDSFNEPEPGTGSDGAVYGQFPPLVKASKPAGEWNLLEVTLIGNKLTAKLNGQVIHDNREITQVTGGALPGGVEDPGPLMLQGDHGKVWYRHIEIRPIATRAAE